MAFFRIAQNKIKMNDPLLSDSIAAGLLIISGQTIGANNVSLTNAGNATDVSVESVSFPFNSVCNLEGQLSVKYNEDNQPGSAAWNVRIAAFRDAYAVTIISSQLTEIGFNNLSLSPTIEVFDSGIKIVATGVSGITLDWFAFLNYQFSKSIN